MNTDWCSWRENDITFQTHLISRQKCLVFMHTCFTRGATTVQKFGGSAEGAVLGWIWASRCNHSGDFATWLFPNYFGQDLFRTLLEFVNHFHHSSCYKVYNTAFLQLTMPKVLLRGPIAYCPRIPMVFLCGWFSLNYPGIYSYLLHVSPIDTTSLHFEHVTSPPQSHLGRARRHPSRRQSHW